MEKKPYSSKPTSENTILTVDEVAALLRCTDRHVANLCKRGLPHFHVGRLLRFDREQVLAHLQNNARLSLHCERKAIRARALGKEVRS